MEIKEATIQEPTNPTSTPVFDFTATINAALAQAIALATAPLVERINNLQNSATTDIANLTKRIAELEARIDGATLTPLTHEYIAKVARESVEVSEDRIKEIADEVARDVMSEHVGDYDHDEYDRLFDNIGDRIDEAINEAVDDLDISDKINDALNGATVSISV